MSKYSERFKIPQLKPSTQIRKITENKNRAVRRQNAFDETRQMSHEEQVPVKTKLELRIERLKLFQEAKNKKIQAENANKKPGWKNPKARYSTFGNVGNEKNNESASHIKSCRSNQPSSHQQPKSCVKSSKTIPEKNSKKTVTNKQPNKTVKTPEIVVNHVSTPCTPSTSNYQLIPGHHEFRRPFSQKQVDKILRQTLPLTPTNIVTRAKKRKGVDELLDITYNTFSNIENDRNISLTSTPSLATATGTEAGLFVVTPMKMPPKLGKSSRPAAGPLFEDMLELEIVRLNSICVDWETTLSENSDIPSHIHDEIEATVGQTKLLIAKKFEQFRQLTYGIGSKNIESDDLQGFWDMMYLQVTGLDARFTNLRKLQNNNWKEDVQVVVKKSAKTKTANKVKAVGPSAALKAAIAAAKKKMSEETKENDEETGIIIRQKTPKLERSKNFEEESLNKVEKSNKVKTVGASAALKAAIAAAKKKMSEETKENDEETGTIIRQKTPKLERSKNFEEESSNKVEKSNKVKKVGPSAALKAAIAEAKIKMAGETKENDEEPGTIIQQKTPRFVRSKNFEESSNNEEKLIAEETKENEEKPSNSVRAKTPRKSEEKRKTRPRRTNVFANILKANKENRIGGRSENSLNTSTPK